jgi:hypothetical protein
MPAHQRLRLEDNRGFEQGACAEARQPAGLSFCASPRSKLSHCQLEGFVVEFRGDDGTIVDDVMFHQPNGKFVAKRVEG